MISSSYMGSHQQAVYHDTMYQAFLYQRLIKWNQQLLNWSYMPKAFLYKVTNIRYLIIANKTSIDTISTPPFLKPYMQTMHLHTYSFISYIYTQIERLLCVLFKSLPLNFIYIYVHFLLLICVLLWVWVYTCHGMYVGVRGWPVEVSSLPTLCRVQESYQILWSGLAKRTFTWRPTTLPHSMIFHLLMII